MLRRGRRSETRMSPNPCRGSRASTHLTSNTIYIGKQLQGTKNQECNKLCAQRGSPSNPCTSTREAIELYNSQYPDLYVAFQYLKGTYDDDLPLSIAADSHPVPAKVSLVAPAGGATLGDLQGYTLSPISGLPGVNADPGLPIGSPEISNITFSSPVSASIPSGTIGNWVVSNCTFTAGEDRPGLFLDVSGGVSNWTANGNRHISDTAQEAVKILTKNSGISTWTGAQNSYESRLEDGESTLRLENEDGSGALSFNDTNSKGISASKNLLNIINNTNGTLQGKDAASLALTMPGMDMKHTGLEELMRVITNGDSKTDFQASQGKAVSPGTVLRAATTDAGKQALGLSGMNMTSAVGAVHNIDQSSGGSTNLTDSSGTYTAGTDELPAQESTFGLNVSGGNLTHIVSNRNAQVKTGDGIPSTRYFSTGPGSNIISKHTGNLELNFGSGDLMSYEGSDRSNQTHYHSNSNHALLSGVGRKITVDDTATVSHRDSNHTLSHLAGSTENRLEDYTTSGGNIGLNENGAYKEAKTNNKGSILYKAAGGGNIIGGTANNVHKNIFGSIMDGDITGPSGLDITHTGHTFEAKDDTFNFVGDALSTVSATFTNGKSDSKNLGKMVAGTPGDGETDASKKLTMTGTSAKTRNDGTEVDDNGNTIGALHVKGNVSTLLNTNDHEQNGTGAAQTMYDPSGKQTVRMANSAVKHTIPDGAASTPASPTIALQGVDANHESVALTKTASDKVPSTGSMVQAKAYVDSGTGQVTAQTSLTSTSSKFSISDTMTHPVHELGSDHPDDRTQYTGSQLNSGAVAQQPFADVKSGQSTFNNIAVKKSPDESQDVIRGSATAVVATGSNVAAAPNDSQKVNAPNQVTLPNKYAK